MTRTIVALITGVLLGAFLTKVSSGNKSSESSIQNPASLALEQAESVLNADLGDLDPRYVQMFDALAAIVDQEVAERRRLEERLDQLSAQLKGEPQTVTQSAARQDRRNRNSINLQRSLVSRMVDAGLSEQEAQEIKTRLDSISMAELELQYLSQQGSDGQDDLRQAMQDLQAQRRGLRDELGEDKYDRYLFASGQPNRLTVMDVMDDSPAQRAGLRTGDMILRYGGERLWSRRDLRGVSFSGDGGEMMTLDIMRNGRTLQVFMPRGPLGVRLGMDSVNPNDGGGG